MSFSSLEVYAKIVLAIAVLVGGVQAIIVAMGGSFPPWPSASEFGALEKKVERIIADRDSVRCSEAQRRFRNARMRFEASPELLFEQENMELAEREIRSIQNCG